MNAYVAEKFAELYMVQKACVEFNDAINDYMRDNAPLDLHAIVDQMPVPRPKAAEAGTSGGDEWEDACDHGILYDVSVSATTDRRETQYAAILAKVSTLLGEGFQAEIVRVPGDGNCGLHAIAHLTQTSHDHLRALAAQYLRQHPQIFRDFLSEDQTDGHADLDVYIGKMAQSGTYIDQITLMAITSALQLPILVFTAQAESEVCITCLAPPGNPLAECSDLGRMAHACVSGGAIVLGLLQDGREDNGL
ncbi:MAG: OTU domain-containing protein, partial [Promethearchaeia archaeon]